MNFLNINASDLVKYIYLEREDRGKSKIGMDSESMISFAFVFLRGDLEREERVGVGVLGGVGAVVVEVGESGNGVYKGGSRTSMQSLSMSCDL